MLNRFSSECARAVGVLLCLFTLVEVNYAQLSPHSQLAIFAMLGIVLCFLIYPAHRKWQSRKLSQILDLILSGGTVLCCSYVVLQTQPVFRSLWLDGRSLGDRAGVERGLDFLIGFVGLLLVLEVTRRSIGMALPVLALVFIAYAYLGPSLPDWLFPHRGYGLERIISQTFLQSQGVFGMALKVMFTYVFLFVLFGSFLEATGSTQFIIDFARRVFLRSTGGAAKVSVLSSGLMGSLSGSAVANTAATGTFTIPMMRSSGFQPHIAAGVAAAASSGGALVPPIMGAGAYMMLEIIDPPVTYLEIIQAAILPAIIFYLSLLLIVHFYARRIGFQQAEENDAPKSNHELEGIIFFAALGSLIALLVVGYTPFRAVTLATGIIVALSALNPRTRISPRRFPDVLVKAARSGVALVSAASCVGVIIGIVTLTGVGTRFASMLLPMAEQNLFLALVFIMLASITLGMGLPSAVCYLLLATIIGPPLSQLGVVPLAAHFFIFYFGMMSMVTPPVALAAFTGASIAGSPVMKTAMAAFRFALVGFSLPFIFVARPQLLLLSPDGSAASFASVAPVFLLAFLGVIPLAAGIAGYLVGPLRLVERSLMLLSAVLVLYPAGDTPFSFTAISGLVLLAGLALWNWASARKATLPDGSSA
jgi:TRAP transporter 4TM/12TM fusion protein